MQVREVFRSLQQRSFNVSRVQYSYIRVLGGQSSHWLLPVLQCEVQVTDNGQPTPKNASSVISVIVERVPPPDVQPIDVNVNETTPENTRIVNIFEGVVCRNGSVSSSNLCQGQY